MIRSNLSLKLLGLCAMLLGLFAISASGAQAADWMVGANNITSTLLPTVVVKEIEELHDTLDPGRHLVMLAQFSGISLRILCTEAKLEGVKLETEGKVTNGGDVKFGGCVTRFGGSDSEVTACKPGPGGNKSGIILSLPLKGQLNLFGTSFKLVKIESSTAGKFIGDIEFNEDCALPEVLGIGGSLFIKDCSNIETSALDHLIEVDPSSELWLASNTIEHKVTIHGSAIVKLGGTVDPDEPWSGLAE